MKNIFKRIIKMILCKHNYEMYSNLSYREVSTNKRVHELTLICPKCEKIKKLVKFATPDNSGLS